MNERIKRREHSGKKINNKDGSGEKSLACGALVNDDSILQKGSLWGKTGK